jgi:hypothetical protein
MIVNDRQEEWGMEKLPQKNRILSLEPWFAEI